MGILEDTLAYWREQRTALSWQLADLESGKALRSERNGTEWVDKSPEAIATLKGEIAQLNRLLSAYGEDNT